MVVRAWICGKGEGIMRNRDFGNGRDRVRNMNLILTLIIIGIPIISYLLIYLAKEKKSQRL